MAVYTTVSDSASPFIVWLRTRTLVDEGAVLNVLTPRLMVVTAITYIKVVLVHTPTPDLSGLRGSVNVFLAVLAVREEARPFPSA